MKMKQRLDSLLHSLDCPFCFLEFVMMKALTMHGGMCMALGLFPCSMFLFSVCAYQCSIPLPIFWHGLKLFRGISCRKQRRGQGRHRIVNLQSKYAMQIFDISTCCVYCFLLQSVC